MKREIYEVSASVVDANGSYNLLSGFPKAYDSKSYGGDIEKAKRRAYAEFYDTLGAMGKRDDRQLQIASIKEVSTCIQIETKVFGAIADLPDPEPEE